LCKWLRASEVNVGANRPQAEKITWLKHPTAAGAGVSIIMRDAVFWGGMDAYSRQGLLWN